MQRTEKMQEAKRLYQKGERLVDIAKKLNVPDGTVRRWKHVQNWDERSDNPYKEWQKKKEEGCTCNQGIGYKKRNSK